jgi:hypothetical protein
MLNTTDKEIAAFLFKKPRFAFQDRKWLYRDFSQSSLVPP